MAPTTRTEGVIAWQGRMLVYHRGPGDEWRLRFLGEENDVSPSPELLAALEADLRHQDHKLQQTD